LEDIMKKIIQYITLIGVSLALISCESLFDNAEGDLTKMSGQDMVSSEPGMQRILANLYGYIPMNAFSTGDQNTFFANNSRSSQSYSNSGVSSFWNYSQIRSINKFLEALDAAVANGTISASTRDSYRGEALFIRAYCYFGGVRKYGGLPIVTTSLDDKYDGGANEGLYFPRQTERTPGIGFLMSWGQQPNCCPNPSRPARCGSTSTPRLRSRRGSRFGRHP